MKKPLKNLWNDIRGNSFMLFTLAIPVIFLAIGGAVDFSRATQLRGQMQDAADIASIGSVAVNSPAFKAALSMKNGTIAIGGQKAKDIFNANYLPQKDLSKLKISAKVTKSGSVMTSIVKVTGSYHPYILGLMGLSAIPVEVDSTSTATMPPFIDFYLLLDNTPSMGVGATTADIDTMVANTPDKCAFACHEGDKPNADYYALAKTLHVTTRIDVLRQATQKMMTKAKDTETLDGQFRVAIYHFGVAADAIDAQNPPPYAVSALNSDLDQTAANAAAIDLMTIPYQGYNSDRQTNMASVLKGMEKIIPKAGDGSMSTKPQQVLFFVSDGANDSYDCAYANGNTCRRITPLDTTTCNTLKARGVKVAVLYTTYLPLPTNSFYNQWMAKYISPTSQIADQMKACASDGLFFEVSPSQGIADAMSALFNKVISVVKIDS